MLDKMESLRRTHYCTQVGEEQIGQTVVVCGFTQKARDLGNLVFLDLRDRTGILQLAFDDTSDRAIFEKAGTVRGEDVLMAQGVVRKRESVNKELKTGTVEVFVTDLRILSRAQTPPFEILDDTNVKEDLRLKYRYLDLRRGKLQRSLLLRHEIARVTREYFYENGFLELETPMLMKSTPEGARDYLVPSRVHHGSFYALPQSPQIYKQLLMISGFDRYVQLSRCFRDEDLRADRQPEFTQIDVEMSFVDLEDLLALEEGYVKRLLSQVLGVEIPTPLPRLTYQEAMERFGSDKPDTRFGMELQDLSDVVKDTEFVVFQNALQAGGSVRAIVAKDAAGTLTRKEIDKLTEAAKGIGAKGLAYIRWVEDKPACSFAKFLKEGELEAILERLGCEKGDVALIVADKNSVTLPVLGALRLTLGKRLDLIPAGWNFLFIVQFPFFERDEETGEWVAMHNPFTMPMDECLPLLESDPGAVKAKAFDLVLNGIELSSGAIRITDPALQKRMFERLGMTDEEIALKFGFLVDAYQFAAPPHGGFGLGLDRIAMLMAGADNLRDVVAFPKVQNASELMSGCPAPVEQKDLDVLAIQVAKE